MYLARAFRRAFAETKQFWSIHRNWTYIASAASGVVLQGLWKGWHTVADIKQLALFAVFGYVFSWTGNFLINLVLAPALLDADRQSEIRILEQKYTEKLKELANALEQEKQLRLVNEAELRRQLLEPKIIPEILSYEIEEVERPRNVFLPDPFCDTDTIVKLSIRLMNEHRQPTTIQKCELSVRARPPGVLWGSVDEPIRDVQNYVRVNLDAPVEYGCPRSGWLFFRLQRRKKEDIIAGTLELSVTDGTGKTETARRYIS
jgi:hypothetical protein